MALHLYTSNRMELLVLSLIQVLDQEKIPPLEPETIIVQSQGMARFLAMEMAGRNGVWAGGAFPFPNAFLGDIFQQVLAGEEASGEWQRGPLSWRIHKLLPSLLERPEFDVVASYCQTSVKRFQLSQQVSDLFDQYVLYRPEMIRAWGEGEDDSWQAVLWRHLAEHDTPHRADQFDRVLKKLSESSIAGLPRRITLFGISSMAPRMIAVFAALAQHIEVHIFFLNPCQEEWSLIMTRGSITKVELTTGVDKEEQFLDNGNELLASMGHLGRDFFDLLLNYDPLMTELYSGAETPSLLSSIQDDILALQPPSPSQHMDGSLHLVSCHNAMREVEVLLDHLLHLFTANPDLKPGDVLVMAPDIGDYAPLIDAVFRVSATVHIPYSIADQAMQDLECFAGLLALVKMAKGRWRVSDLMALLEIPALCQQFGFNADDIDEIREWLMAVHIHWGRDRRHRLKLGLPASSEHSFRSGINRLLLGFAMEGDELFMGMLPFAGGELNVDLASRFLSFYERLLGLASFLEGDRSPEEWSRGLLDAVDSFFAPDKEQEWQITQLRGILTSLGQDALQADFKGDVEPEIIFTWLKKALNLDLSPYGFLSGGITFCSLLPMRAIPFKVVCLLGMNDGDFPRSQIRPGFDLTARDYHKGDRNKRNDDRYLFLEAVLSAREQLYISFIGHSITDNRQMLPSVLVSELMEYMTCCLQPDEDTELVVAHPIQPFNSRYFNGKLPRSFSTENYEACLAFIESRGQQRCGFLNGLAVEKTSALEPVLLTDLLRFWKNPTAFFCRKTLGLVFDGADHELEDDEPFSLSGLAGYQVEERCVDSLLSGEQPDFKAMRATGFLPQGIVGEMAFGQVAARAGKLVSRVEMGLTSPCDEVQATIKCGKYTLEVVLDHLYSSGQIFTRIGGKIDGRHIIQAWLCHVVLQMVDVSCPKTTVLVSADEMVEWQALADSEAILTTLLDYYFQGMTEPLPFFVKSSWAYSRWLDEKDPATAMKKALECFEPGFNRWSPEAAEPAVLRCFGEDYTLEAPFVELASAVFSELFSVAVLDLGRK